MSRSSVELDGVSQQGAVDSLTQSLRGLANSLTTASTDSLTPDAREWTLQTTSLCLMGIRIISHGALPLCHPEVRGYL